eukprot:m.339809 g.339809  ORF g.339809 m.339809 type:complete len:196 (-) comp18978_c0_seq1:841-1428(-)
MGALFSNLRYPLDASPLCYELQQDFDECGERIQRQENQESLSHYHLAQQPFWDVVLEQRAKSTVAREMYTDTNVSEYARLYPQWNERDIANMRDQFMTFDLNEDGLIDCDELNILLDRLGDKTSLEERQAYFQAVDDDESNGVDFVEFLQLVSQVTTGKADAQCGFGKVYVETVNQHTSTYNELTEEQQLKAGLL